MDSESTDGARWRIAVDVGGTFTDVVATDDRDRMLALKVLSTPDAFDVGVCEGVRQALRAAGTPGACVSQILHGTTVATNAVLQGSGPPCALVTTKGFRDVLEIGRLRTPAIYDLAWVKPPPLVPRHRRLEVEERIASDGVVLTKLDLEPLSSQLDAVVVQGVQSVAVALLNSYVNPEHEKAVAAWLADRYPALSVTVSSSVIREIGEYERTSTAVLNAYLRPVVSAYVGRLTAGLSEERVDAAIFVMQSSGGMMPVAEAGQYPVQLLESGPAAGVLAAAGIAAQTGTRTAISFDMGGTTAKASLIEEGEVAHAPEFTIGSDVSASSRLLRGGGYAVRLPVVDLAEIGAGGGSVAAVDPVGGLSVGPQSAGADPGPACYGRGGDRATVTDANLVLGYLSPAGLARGGVTAQPELARAAIATQVAEPLGLTIFEAALAIHAVANQQMARVLRAVSTERGRGLAEQTLIVSGGSGGLHAAALADSVGIRTVLVPPLAGVLSAVGLLWSPVALTAVETTDVRLDRAAAQPLNRHLDAIAAGLQSRLSVCGLGRETTVVSRVLDLRYAGQASELSLPLPEGALDDDGVDDLVERFHAEHLVTYGHGGHQAVAVVRVRVTVAIHRPVTPLVPLTGNQEGSDQARDVHFGGQPTLARVVMRADLTDRHAGPLLIDETDTTIVVPPGWSARLDAFQHVVLERSA